MAKIYTKGSTVVDEVLSGAEAYEIVKAGGGAIANVSELADAAINLTTPVTVAGTLINAARLNNIETGIDTLDTKVADANDLLTTGGTTTAYTLTTTGAAALATGERFRVKFNATAGATPTLNRDSKGAKSLKYYNSAGAKTDCTSSNIVANLISDVVYDGTNYVVLDPAGVTGGGGGASVDGWNAVTWATLTRTGATTFTTTTDVTAIIQKGDKIKYTDTTTKYGVVYSVSAYTTICTITFIATSDYALVGNPSTMSYSKIENPQGWPGWFNFATAISNEGSTQPSQGNGTLTGKYTTIGKTVAGFVQLTWGSTTSAGTGNYLNFLLPVTASSSVVVGTMLGTGRVLDAGTQVYTAMASLITTTKMRLLNAGPSAAAALSWGTLFTPATGDEWAGAFTYEF